MEPPIKNFDELLSGMLDGRLSAADSVELQREMAKNPSLQGRLDELVALRQALLRGRSTKSLRPDFASSVSIAAKKRASEMGADAPKWLLPAKTAEQFQKSLPQKAVNSVPSRRWIYAGLSLAATLLIVFLAIPEAKRQGTDTGPNADSIASNDPLNTPDAPIEVLETKADIDWIASANPTTANPTTVNPATVNPATVNPATTNPTTTNALASALATQQDDTPSPVDKGPPLDVKGNGVIDPLAPLAVPKQNLYYTVVLDVSIDPQAIENRTLERILEKYDIVSTDDLIVNDDQLKHLEESKLVGNTANTEEKMGVMFLRSSAKKLDSAMVDIINGFQDFPEFAMDVTTDRSALLLVNQLSSIRVAEGKSDTASRLLLAKAPGRNSPFATTARRGKPMDNASRGKFKGGAVPANPAGDEISYALLLLRPAKKSL